MVFSLGDHDPSGLDMTQDIGDRLNLFTSGYCKVEVKRLALNRDQVDIYGLPPNPVKLTDTRAADYVQHHGKIWWELDALDPSVISDLIADAVEQYRDADLWEESNLIEQEHRRLLSSVAESLQAH